MEFYALPDKDDGLISELHLGPVTVTWHTSLEDRVAVKISSGNKSVTVYSSKTGRSLRVFRDSEEMS